MGAQPLTPIGTERAQGKLQHQLLLQRFAQIDFIPLEKHNSHFVSRELDLFTALIFHGGGFATECQDEIGGKWHPDRGKTATAIECHLGGNAALNLDEPVGPESTNLTGYRREKPALASLFNLFQGGELIGLFGDIDDDFPLPELIDLKTQFAPMSKLENG